MWRLGILFGLACRLFSQTVAVPADKPAAEWIRSGEPFKQAWAAHWVAEQHADRLVPELLRVLADPLPMSTGDAKGVSDAEAARLAILDALIQMKQGAPLADLYPSIEDFPTEVLILAARSQEDNRSLLLKLLDRSHNYSAFVTIGNLLTPRRDVDFASRALQEFSVRDEIMVFSPGQDQNIGSGWSGDTLFKGDEERPGWPETGTYMLIVNQPIPGRRALTPAGMIADGKYKVWIQRLVGKTFIDHGFQDYSSERGRTIPDRVEEFLASYLDIDVAKLPIRADETLKITWVGDDDFGNRLTQYFAGQRVRYALLLQALITRKYLSPENGTSLQLKILPYITDERNGERTELPDLKALAEVH